VMAAITGMLFGLIPAVRASRLEPVAALRFE
jgi:ABC-type antimicrobial peptide transport system permease subunit